MEINTTNSVGLVLGGGGARGFFHIGVIKALQELNVQVSEVSGTSIGALIGTIYAHNPDFNFDEIIGNVNYTALAKIAYQKINVISITSFKKYIRNLVNVESFSELKIPLSFSATDINTGEELVFREGDIFPALLASMAIPGIFPLVEYDNKVLCDGGLVNNLPTNLIRQENLPLIVSDIRLQKNIITKKSSKLKIMKNVYLIPRYKIMHEELQKTTKNHAIVHLEFHDHYHVLNFRKSSLKKMIDIGYKTTMDNKNAILNL